MRPRGSLIPAADALAPDFSSYRITVGLLGLNWRPAPGPRWSRAGGGHVRAVVTGGNGRTHDPYLRSGCHRGRSRCVRGPNLASCASLATVWGVIPWIRRPKQPLRTEARTAAQTEARTATQTDGTLMDGCAIWSDEPSAVRPARQPNQPSDAIRPALPRPVECASMADVNPLDLAARPQPPRVADHRFRRVPCGVS